MKSWKTTVAGVATIVTTVAAAVAAYFDGDPATVVNWEVTITAVLVGLGLASARDDKVSSEEAGAK